MRSTFNGEEIHSEAQVPQYGALTKCYSLPCIILKVSSTDKEQGCKISCKCASRTRTCPLWDKMVINYG